MRRLCLTAAAMFGLGTTGAWAQTPSPLAQWQYAPGVALAQRFETPADGDWRVALGLGMEVLPTYPGSDRVTATGGPDVDIRYRDLLFLSSGEGLGITPLHGDDYRIGVALGYDLGRRQGDDPRLAGMGNISPAPVPRLFAQVVLFPVTLQLDLRRAIGGYDGAFADLGAYTPVAGSDRFAVFVGASATLGDDHAMQSWYGVGREQSANSGYPAYHATAGLESVRLGLFGIWFFTGDRTWYVDSNASVQRLLGSAADSPLTASTLQGAVTFDVGYYFP